MMSSWVNTEPVSSAFSATARQLFLGELEFTEQLHSRLAVAVCYLAKNYHSEISQMELAEQACVSPSHLAYLFRAQLGTRFKALLVELRLLYAVSLLRSDPRTLITDLCLLCGFGDLSHFEKMFRRYLGVSPREFRRTLNAPAPVQAVKPNTRAALAAPALHF